MRTEQLAPDVTLYCGDCAEILPTLGRFDALVTDPPYGIGESGGRAASRLRSTAKWRAPSAPAYDALAWDDAPPARDLVDLMRSKAGAQIIFGGNYFELPPAKCWLVWDKETSGDFADCELAWTNLDKAVRRIRYLWNGMCRANNEPRGDHPTQKPLGVMLWCLDHLPAEARTIMDPFMGSGTTGVAAVKRGKAFVGIEREPAYFDIACRRIADALRAPDLFVAPAPPAAPKQEAFL